MKAELKFQTLEHIVRVYQERGENIMGDLARPIAEALHAEVMNVFETDGYGKWPGFWWQRRGLPKPGSPKAGPLRRSGKARKRDQRLLRRGKLAKSFRRWQGTPKLLRDRGILIGSLTPFTAEDLVEVYTNVPYAKYHVSAAPRHKIPLRDFFDIDRDAFELDIVDMINVHLGRPFTVAA